MRVLRIYHAGRDAAHRGRERALVAAGVEVTLVVPTAWPGDPTGPIVDERFEVVALPVTRGGDVNRHRYAETAALGDVVGHVRPDVVDIHEEPFSAVTHQVLGVVPEGVPVIGYTAQNLDKRYPPPFTTWERAAFGRCTAIAPCSRQAASVIRGRGYSGAITVLPLGFDPTSFRPGDQRHDAEVLQLALVGRMVEEKGVRDAVAVLAAVREYRNARLVLVGAGPELDRVASYAASRETGEAIDIRPWSSVEDLTAVYQSSHVVLVPSRATNRWVEQFGRVVVEAQACGAVVAGYASGTISEVADGAAWLAAEGDAIGLSRAVVDVAGSSQLWSDLRTRGLVAAATKTWDAVADGQRAMYEAAIASGPVAAGRATAASRAAAVAEFGPPAVTADGQARPFALPLLRRLPLSARR